jgi:ribosome-binding ATPase YchF (GTP1/OBG family)
LAKTVGLVGKANVGKSTFFGAATLKPVEIAAFPFTTIKADRGIAYIRAACVCKELEVEDNPVNSACVDGTRLIPVDIIDTPGLIPGAHQGKGLGNQFLDEVRRADALIVVADASGCTDISGHVCDPMTHDPIEDVTMFEEEFDLWLNSLILKDWDKVTRTAQSKKESLERHLEEKLTGLGINRSQIKEATIAANLDPYKASQWKPEEIRNFVTKLRKTSKPLIVAANKADRDGAEINIGRLKKAGYEVIPTCAEAELALRRATEAGLVEYTPGDNNFKIKNPDKLNEAQLKALERIRDKVFEKWGSTGLQDALNKSFFKLLNMVIVYPVEDSDKLTNHQGQVLPDCYLVPRGTTAKQFAGEIHSDLQEGFLFAVDARSKKRLGDSYILEDNDIIQIVSAKGRK